VARPRSVASLDAAGSAKLRPHRQRSRWLAHPPQCL